MKSLSALCNSDRTQRPRPSLGSTSRSHKFNAVFEPPLLTGSGMASRWLAREMAGRLEGSRQVSARGGTELCRSRRVTHRRRDRYHRPGATQPAAHRRRRSGGGPPPHCWGGLCILIHASRGTLGGTLRRQGMTRIGAGPPRSARTSRRCRSRGRSGRSRRILAPAAPGPAGATHAAPLRHRRHCRVRLERPAQADGRRREPSRLTLPSRLPDSV